MDSHKKHFELVGTMRLGPKGQVVIPAEVREAMAVKPGDKLVALFMSDKQAISFMPESCLQAIIDKMGANVEELRAGLDTTNK